MNNRCAAKLPQTFLVLISAPAALALNVFFYSDAWKEEDRFDQNEYKLEFNWCQSANMIPYSKKRPTGDITEGLSNVWTLF